MHGVPHLDISQLEHTSSDVLVGKVDLQVSVSVFDEAFPLARKLAEEDLRFTPENGCIFFRYSLPHDRYVQREKLFVFLTLCTSYAVKVSQQTEEFAVLTLARVDLQKVGKEEILEPALGPVEGAEEGQAEKTAHLATTEQHFLVYLLTEKLWGERSIHTHTQRVLVKWMIRLSNSFLAFI